MFAGFNLDKPIIMGILNTSTNSFSNDGKGSLDNAFIYAKKLIEDGADIIDIGGVSSAPMANSVDIKTEIDRVIPLVKRLSGETDVKISVDTTNSFVMEEALKNGATIINDISALSNDSKSAEIVAKYSACVILMHKRGTPKTMVNLKDYDNLLNIVYSYLEERLLFAINNGISKENIALDVGLGFAKNANQNVELQKNMGIFLKLGCPLVLGASRKETISKITGEAAVDKRLGGGIASAIFAYSKGVKIFRTHDVFETKQALSMFSALVE